MKRKLKFKFFLMDITFHTIVYSGIIIGSILNKRYIETLILLISFFTLRYAFPKTYHCETIKWCAFWSIAIFWIALPWTLPISISLFSSIVIGCAMTGALYLWQEFIDLKKFKSQFTVSSFENCTTEQIEYACKLNRYSKSKTEIARMFFVDKLSNEEVWKILCSTQRNVAWDSVRQMKWRMHKELEKYFKN